MIGYGLLWFIVFIWFKVSVLGIDEGIDSFMIGCCVCSIVCRLLLVRFLLVSILLLVIFVVGVVGCVILFMDVFGRLVLMIFDELSWGRDIIECKVDVGKLGWSGFMIFVGCRLSCVFNRVLGLFIELVCIVGVVLGIIFGMLLMFELGKRIFCLFICINKYLFWGRFGILLLVFIVVV